MAEDIEDAQIAYRLKTIEVIEEKMVCPPSPPTQIKKFHFAINLTHKFKREEKLVFVVIEVVITSSENDFIYGSIKVANIFEVKNLDPFIEKETGAVRFSPKFENNLNAISVSTVRGIMFSRFRGTYLHQAILPIIHPSSFKLVKTSA